MARPIYRAPSNTLERVVGFFDATLVAAALTPAAILASIATLSVVAGHVVECDCLFRLDNEEVAIPFEPLSFPERAAPTASNLFWFDCPDYSRGGPQHQRVYEDVARVFPEVSLEIWNHFAIADPARYWTVHLGPPCDIWQYLGTHVDPVEGAFVAVDRQTGVVGDPVHWGTRDSSLPYWVHEDGEWKMIVDP